MMNGYSSISGAMQQSGPAAGQCRCQQRCVCRAGQPCRCSGGCTCSQAGAAQGSARARNWIESGERELRYPRGYPQGYQRGRSAWLRARARNMLQQRLALQQDWTRRTRLNGMFARRFNWGPYLGRAANAIGSPLPQADSRRFMFALARWQRAIGLPVTGVLTPSLLPRLLAAEPLSVAPQAPAQQPDTWSAAPAPDPMAGGPGVEAATDDAALPLPGDTGEPDAMGNEYAVPRGFRSRHAYAY